VMNQATLEELNGYKINIDQDGIGLDQLQAFRNLDRTMESSSLNCSATNRFLPARWLTSVFSVQ
jgi:hypothetical protein